MNQMLSAFGLTDSQMKILFSLENYMSFHDAHKEESISSKLNPLKGKHEMKEKWCNEFQYALFKFISEESNTNNTSEPKLFYSQQQIIQAISVESEKADSEMWKYLVLLECTLFQPYFPLSENADDAKQTKNLKIEDSSKEEMLRMFSIWLNISYDFVKNVTDTYEKTIKKMNGYWNKILIGVGAGIVASVLAVVTAGGSIAALFAASGLYGAAAVSSGLAALGGGAIAAGGFGMAGGMAVLVGGGMLLGSGAGASIAMAIASTNPKGIMMETAKLFVMLKEVILGLNHDTKRAQEIIDGVVDKIASYKKEITRLQALISDNNEQIKNLEKSIKYLEDFLKMAA